MEENNQVPQAPDTVQIAPVTPSNPQDSNIQKPKSKLPLIVIGIVLFLLLAGSAAGFYIVNQQGFKETPKPTTTQIVTKPSPTPNPTADWKTYISDKKYSIKYPPNYSFLPKGSKITVEDILVQPADDAIVYIEQNQPKPHGGGPYGLIMTIRGTTKPSDGLTLRQRLERNFQKRETIVEETKFVDLVINGIPAIKEMVGSKTYYAYIENELKSYSIEIAANSDTNNYELTVDQILSTFKFTNSQIVDTSNWKIYNNSTYNYSFKYPDGYLLDEIKDFTGRWEKNLGVLEVSINTSTLGMGGGHGNIHVQVWTFKKSGLSLQQWIDAHISKVDAQNPQTDEIIYVNPENKKMEVKNGINWQIMDAYRGEGTYTIALTENSNYIYAIVLAGKEFGKDSNIANYYLSILSSFKFTK